MPNPDDTTRPMTRFEAQRKLGLFATHDYISVVFLCFSWAGWFVALPFWSEPYPWRIIAVWVGINIFVMLTWAIVLVYRALVLILDLHADVALMPEAAGRIAASYIEGRAREGSKRK